jgi:RNA polymerase sigma factor (sigma-70 family)
VTAYRALATWRGEGPFGAWMARIAVRVALRHAGRRGKVRELTWMEPPSADAFGPGANGPVASIAATGQAEDPAHQILRSERATQVRSALAGLDESYREIVALRFFGDLSLAEIAATTGRPLNTVKTQLYRGLALLRDSLEPER